MSGTTAARPRPRVVSVAGVWARLCQLALILVTVLVMLVSWLVVQAVIAPGDGSITTRLAEAAREDGFGAVVAGLGSLGSWLNPPHAGGVPDPPPPRLRPEVTLPLSLPGEEARPPQRSGPRP